MISVYLKLMLDLQAYSLDLRSRSDPLCSAFRDTSLFASRTCAEGETIAERLRNYHRRSDKTICSVEQHIFYPLPYIFHYTVYLLFDWMKASNSAPILQHKACLKCKKLLFSRTVASTQIVRHKSIENSKKISKNECHMVLKVGLENVFSQNAIITSATTTITSRLLCLRVYTQSNAFRS